MSRAAFKFGARQLFRLPGKRCRRDNEDWRLEPCRCCKSLVMLWWRFCPFCGTQLPTGLDGKARG